MKEGLKTMLEYKNCIAICSGYMPVHTLQIEQEKISVIHMNNLNQESIQKHYSVKNGFSAAAIAFDRQGNRYTIMRSNAGSIAIIDECIKPLSIQEMIEKYNLPLTEQEYKRIFQIP